MQDHISEIEMERQIQILKGSMMPKAKEDLRKIAVKELTERKPRAKANVEELEMSLLPAVIRAQMLNA